MAVLWTLYYSRLSTRAALAAAAAAQKAATDADKSIAASLKAAEAAEKSARIAEAALTIVERPYLFLKVSGGVPYTEGFIVRGEDKAQPRMPYVWENSGRTPAIIESSRFNSAVRAKIPARPKYVEPAMEGEAVVAAGKSTLEDKWVHLKGIDASDFLALEMGKRHLFWWGYVVYKDIFGHRHMTGFGLRYVPSGRCWTTAGGDRFNFRETETEDR